MPHTNQHPAPPFVEQRNSDIIAPASVLDLRWDGPGWYGPNSKNTDVICYGENALVNPATNGNSYGWFQTRADAARTYVRSGGGQSRVRRTRSQSKRRRSRSRSRSRSRKNGRSKK